MSAAQTTTATRGSSSSGSKSKGFKFSTKEIKISVILLLLVLAYIYHSYARQQEMNYNNTDAGKAEIALRDKQIELEIAKARGEIQKSTTPSQPQATLWQPSQGLLAPGGTLRVSDGDQFIIPENAKAVVHEGATIVIVNSAWRIKSFSGDFTVQQIGTGETPSVPDSGYFKRLPKTPAQTKVRIVVKSGTVEIGT